MTELSLRGINLGQRYSQELAESEYEAHLEEAYAGFETTTALRVTLPWATQEFEETRSLMGGDFWSYGIKHNEVPVIREYLQHSNSFVSRCGPYLVSELVAIEKAGK